MSRWVNFQSHRRRVNGQPMLSEVHEASEEDTKDVGIFQITGGGERFVRSRLHDTAGQSWSKEEARLVDTCWRTAQFVRMLRPREGQTHEHPNTPGRGGKASRGPQWSGCLRVWNAA